MGSSRTLTALLLCIVALPVAAETRYDLSADYCGMPVSDGRLTVTDKALHFYESKCAISGRKNRADGTSDLTFYCGGEGETWTRTVRLQETAKGLRLTDETGSYDYVRCN